MQFGVSGEASSLDDRYKVWQNLNFSRSRSIVTLVCRARVDNFPRDNLYLALGGFINIQDSQI